MDLDVLSLTKNNSKLKISQVGAQVLSFEVKDGAGVWRPFFYTGTTAKRTGVPLLFPFADPLDNNIFELSGLEIPQHGFGRISHWKIHKQNSESITLSLNYKDLEEKWQKAYPFQFEARVKFDISLEDCLQYTLDVINLENSKPLPIAPGLHPYFNCRHEYKSDLYVFINTFVVDMDLNATGAGDYHEWNEYTPETKKKLLIKNNSKSAKYNHRHRIFDGKICDDWTYNRPDLYRRHIWSSKSYSDPFLGQEFIKTAVIDSKDSNYPLIRMIDVNNKAENLVFWTQDESSPDHDFICLEPFTKKANSINTDPILVAPSEVWDWKIIFEYN